MRSKLLTVYIWSSGIVLLVLATAQLIALGLNAELIPPRDPLLGFSVNQVLPFIAGAEMVVALFCLFGDEIRLQVGLLCWLAFNFAVYLGGLHWIGCGHFHAYSGNLPDAFAIPSATADLVIKGAFAYLLAGGLMSLGLIWTAKSPADLPLSELDYSRMTCSACGRHIKFASHNVGLQISCPQCQAPLTLRSSGYLKTTCYFCKEHIEFPDYALGTKMPCPHCRRGITLKELPVQ